MPLQSFKDSATYVAIDIATKLVSAVGVFALVFAFLSPWAQKQLRLIRADQLGVQGYSYFEIDVVGTPTPSVRPAAMCEFANAIALDATVSVPLLLAACDTARAPAPAHAVAFRRDIPQVADRIAITKGYCAKKPAHCVVDAQFFLVDPSLPERLANHSEDTSLLKRGDLLWSVGKNNLRAVLIDPLKKIDDHPKTLELQRGDCVVVLEPTEQIANTTFAYHGEWVKVATSSCGIFN